MTVAVAGRWGVAVSITHAARGRQTPVCLSARIPSPLPPSQCASAVHCIGRLPSSSSEASSPARTHSLSSAVPRRAHDDGGDDEDDAGSVRGSPFLFLWVGVLHALRVVHHCTAPILANNKTLRGAVRNRPSCGGLRLDRGFVDRCARASRGLLSVYTPAHRVVAGVTYGPPYSIIHVSCMQIVLVLHL